MIKRSLRLLLFACLSTAASWAVNNPFAGDWKLDPAKSTLTNQMKVERVADNKYAFDFGGGAETIVVDGTDQRSQLYADNTLSVAAEGDTWKVVRKKDGHTIITATWSLSKDGNALTDHFTSFNADGSPYTLNYVYKRKAPGSGFAGEWVSTSLEAVNYVVEFRIQPYEGDGVAFIDASAQFTGSMNFAASMVRKLDERTVELMRRKNGGEPSDWLELKVSPDLKTLTITPHSTPGVEPRTFVFDRQ